LAAVCLFGWGCGPKPVLERGWIGGDYAEVKAPRLGTDPYRSRLDGQIRGLPEPVEKEQSGALLVERVCDGTPVSEAGIREGDLLYRIDDKKIASLGDFRSSVDALSPGKTAALCIYRDGETIEKSVRIGRERYQKVGSLSLGLRLAPEVRITSGPDVSILSVVSLKCGHERVNLQAPGVVYLARNAPEAKPGENLLWDVWLGVFGLSRSESIVNQETAGD
jgi:membrane-associated protease RseP (regulator of RpoE activity)